MTRASAARRRALRIGFTLGSLFLGVHLLLPLAGGLEATAEALARASWWLAGVLLVLEAASFWAYGELLLVVLRGAGERAPRNLIQRSNVVGASLGKMMPGGSATASRIAEAAAARGAADGSLLAGPASVASGVAACRAINQYFLGNVRGIAETARPALELEEAGSEAAAGLARGRRRRCGYRGSVRIATWNVNSVKQRVPRLLPWLDERRPDVVCLQETKLADDAFLDLLGDELRDRGYAVAVHGEATWNGVAILSRVGLDDVVVGLAGAPGFPRPESRAVSATCGGIRVVSVYVPNGRVPDSEHYQYKLAWLASLREMVAAGPEATVVCGDMNIAPTDDDVFDPEAYVGQTHVTPLERAALAELQALGLRDVVRDRWPNERVFTYWDYRAGMFHQDLGMRIDLVLASETVAGRVRAAWVDRQARKGSGPSDHAPVIVDMDEAPDGDIGPVVPPPSAPVTTRGSPKLPQSP